MSISIPIETRRHALPFDEPRGPQRALFEFRHGQHRKAYTDPIPTNGTVLVNLAVAPGLIYRKFYIGWVVDAITTGFTILPPSRIDFLLENSLVESIPVHWSIQPHALRNAAGGATNNQGSYSPLPRFTVYRSQEASSGAVTGFGSQVDLNAGADDLVWQTGMVNSADGIVHHTCVMSPLRLVGEFDSVQFRIWRGTYGTTGDGDLFDFRMACLSQSRAY